MASITGESQNIFNVQNIPQILRVQCLEAVIHSVLRPDEDSLSNSPTVSAPDTVPFTWIVTFTLDELWCVRVI